MGGDDKLRMLGIPTTRRLASDRRTSGWSPISESRGTPAAGTSCRGVCKAGTGSGVRRPKGESPGPWTGDRPRATASLPRRRSICGADIFGKRINSPQFLDESLLERRNYSGGCSTRRRNPARLRAERPQRSRFVGGPHSGDRGPKWVSRSKSDSRQRVSQPSDFRVGIRSPKLGQNGLGRVQVHFL